MNSQRHLTQVKRFACGLGMATVFMVSAAHAQKAPSTAKPIKFDNWTLNCVQIQDKDNNPIKTCDVRSDIVVQDEKSGKQVHALTILFARSMADKAPQAVLRLPLSAFLGSNPRLVGGDNKPVAEYGWVGCQPQLCGAMVQLTDAQMGLVRKMGDRFAVLYRNQLGQDIRIDGSTKGLQAALDALTKEK